MQTFQDLNLFVLIVGNARSGSTMLGSLLDAHPNACIANESSASTTFWRNLGRDDILREIEEYSANHRAMGRDGGGYVYAVPSNCSIKTGITVMGDKIWNPATLLLHGDNSLIPRLESTLQVPVKIVHAVRNPFDTIATMHARSGATIKNRTHWYFMHCDAAIAIRESCREEHFLDVHHEDVIRSPEVTTGKICRFLGLDERVFPLEPFKEMLFKESKKTRFQNKWNDQDIQRIQEGLRRYSFLETYRNEDYSTLYQEP